MALSSKRNIIPFLFLVLLAVFFTSADYARAERRYVSDILVVVLRDAPSTNYNTIKTLKSDTPVEVLDETEEYSRVKTMEGEEGYISKQYLTPDTPKPIIISRLKKENEKLRLSVSRMEDELSETKKQLGSTSDRYSEELHKYQTTAQHSQEEVSRLTQELAALQVKHQSFLENSKDTVELIQSKDRLLKENQTLSSEVNQLRQDNYQLQRAGAIQWFLAGGGVLLLGFILGKIGSKRKRFY